MRAFLCVALILACGAGSVPPPAPATAAYPELERAVVRLVNAHRAGRHLRALVADSSLAGIARQQIIARLLPLTSSRNEAIHDTVEMSNGTASAQVPRCGEPHREPNQVPKPIAEQVKRAAQ